MRTDSDLMTCRTVWNGRRSLSQSTNARSREDWVVSSSGSWIWEEKTHVTLAHLMHFCTFKPTSIMILMHSFSPSDYRQSPSVQAFAHTRTLMCAWETNHMGFVCVCVLCIEISSFTYTITVPLCVTAILLWSMHLKQTLQNKINAFIYIKHQYNQ